MKKLKDFKCRVLISTDLVIAYFNLFLCCFLSFLARLFVHFFLAYLFICLIVYLLPFLPFSSLICFLVCLFSWLLVCLLSIFSLFCMLFCFLLFLLAFVLFFRLFRPSLLACLAEYLYPQRIFLFFIPYFMIWNKITYNSTDSSIVDFTRN